ncbi:MAG: DUF1598 domain-containing protein [Patescibacteria group bacterium]|nr:DUF1598 domain-containing protein [Patescibacteria group bacterium]
MSSRLVQLTILAALLVAALAFTPACMAQVIGDVAAGVAIDADGVLRTKMYADPGGQLLKERIAAARASLDQTLVRPTPMRKVSLTRLEKAIADAGGVVTDEMRYLAGLQRAKYVFCYPDSGDIVIAGPAEGWVTDASGRVVGMTTGRPVVQLEDLVVAMRAFPPGGKSTPLIGCSIDPTAEGLAAMQQFLRQVGSFATPSHTQTIVDGLRNNLGYQTVSINGINPKTRFAQILVEADYRMKLIGIGLEQPPVRLVSYVDRANPAQVSRNAMQRWFFTPDYECVRVAPDRLAMELVGDGVKLVGEDELVTSEGERVVAGRGNKASEAFVGSFTQNYPQLAARSPVYADLRNLIDLAITAAYMQEEDFYGKTRWSMPLLGDEGKFAVERYSPPRQVETAVNAIWKGNRLMTPVGGGVTIEATRAVREAQPDEAGQVAKLREQTTVQLAEGQWWWD